MSRRSRFHQSLVCALVLAGSTGCEPAPPESTGTADLAAIAALRAQFQSAENAGDVDALAATLAEDVILMAPNRPAIQGAAATVAHFRDQFALVVLDLQYASLESVASGEWGFDRGTYSATVTPRAGGEPTTSRGKYIWISRRAADGRWRLARVTWNGDGGGGG